MIYPKTPFCPANNCTDRSGGNKSKNNDKPKSDYNYNPEHNNGMTNGNVQNGMRYTDNENNMMNGEMREGMRYDGTQNGMMNGEMRDGMRYDGTQNGMMNGEMRDGMRYDGTQNGMMNGEMREGMRYDGTQNGMMNGEMREGMRYDGTQNGMRNSGNYDAVDNANRSNLGRTALPQNGQILVEPEKMTQSQLMQGIRELEFVVTDLNLFLDTHPYDEQALEMFTTLAATLKSYKYDYEKRFGPICADGVKNKVPFEWVADGLKWPWQN